MYWCATVHSQRGIFHITCTEMLKTHVTSLSFPLYLFLSLFPESLVTTIAPISSATATPPTPGQLETAPTSTPGRDKNNKEELCDNSKCC